MISRETAAEPGKWVTERAPYLREIMDTITDPDVHTVAVMSSSQVGKTELLLNTIGYYVQHDPGPMMVVLPRELDAQEFSKDRLANMVRDTPVLTRLVADPKAKDSGNTILHKTFPGGQISLVGANSPAGLAARPVRVVLADEIDRYPVSAGGEGDPVKLADRRTETFWRARRVRTSTPTTKGGSRIEAEYERSDQRRYWIPCEDCGEFQTLKWSQVRWPEGAPDEAVYVCEANGCVWDDAQRWRSLHRGEWRAGAELRGVAGFHLWAAYSPWVKLGDKAVEFLEVKTQPELLRQFVNTVLGESFEERGEGVEGDGLLERRERYGPESVPDGVRIVTVGVDVQADRLEVSAIGWGDGEESWVIEHVQLYGDPAVDPVWNQLDEYLGDVYVKSDDSTLKVAAACVDSGGHFTDRVVRFAAARSGRRVFAIRGVGGEGKPIWPRRASRSKRTGAPVFNVGVDAAKEIIMSRLGGVADEGPGYWHFAESLDQEYFEQLTSEQVRTTYRLGAAKRAWVKIRNRNEGLDCAVYAYAALVSTGARLDRRRGGESPAKKARKRRPHRPGGWMQGIG